MLRQLQLYVVVVLWVVWGLASAAGENTKTHGPPQTSPVQKSSSDQTRSPPLSDEGPQNLECHQVPAAPGPTIVCVNRPESSLKDYLAPAISFLALLLSLGTIRYTYRKDAHSRRQSVEDDFWLRKVISPIALEPFIKEVNELAADLPNDCANRQRGGADYRTFVKDWQPKLQRMQSSMQVLALLDVSVCQRTITEIQIIEDILLEYCGANAKGATKSDGLPEKPRADTQERLSQQVIKLLSAIRQYQLHQVSLTLPTKGGRNILSFSRKNNRH